MEFVSKDKKMKWVVMGEENEWYVQEYYLYEPSAYVEDSHYPSDGCFLSQDIACDVAEGFQQSYNVGFNRAVTRISERFRELDLFKIAMS